MTVRPDARARRTSSIASRLERCTKYAAAPDTSVIARARLTAAASDSGGRLAPFCRLDPREGGKIAVAEAARNLTCSGARPLAVTDNLNFGNPYKPENFWQLRESVEGIGEACRAFGTPVTGGNVSLYNESQAGVIDPTPTIGDLTHGDNLYVEGADVQITLLHPPGYDYYRLLRSKLHWGRGGHSGAPDA